MNVNDFGKKIMILRKLCKIMGLSSLEDTTTKICNLNFKNDENNFINSFVECCGGKFLSDNTIQYKEKNIFVCNECRNISTIDSATKLFREMLDECNIKYKCSRNSKTNYFVLENDKISNYERVGDFCIKKSYNNKMYSMIKMNYFNDKTIGNYVSYFDYLNSSVNGYGRSDSHYVLTFEEKFTHVSKIFFVFNLDNCDDIDNDLIDYVSIDKINDNNLEHKYNSNSSLIYILNDNFEKFKIGNYVYYYYEISCDDIKNTDITYFRILLNPKSNSFEKIIDISAIGEFFVFNKMDKKIDNPIQSNIGKIFTTNDTIEKKFTNGYSTYTHINEDNENELEIHPNSATGYIKAVHYDKKPKKIIHTLINNFSLIYDEVIINAISKLYNNKNFAFTLPFYNSSVKDNSICLSSAITQKFILSYSDNSEKNINFAFETCNIEMNNDEKLTYFENGNFLPSYCKMKNFMNKDSLFDIPEYQNNTYKISKDVKNLYYISYQSNRLDDLINNNLDFDSNAQCIKYGKKIYSIIKIVLHNINNIEKPKYGEFFCEHNTKK